MAPYPADPLDRGRFSGMGSAAAGALRVHRRHDRSCRVGGSAAHTIIKGNLLRDPRCSAAGNGPCRALTEGLKVVTLESPSTTRTSRSSARRSGRPMIRSASRS